MKKLLSIITAILLCTNFVRSQAPPWVWGRAGTGSTEGMCVTTDAVGNAYLGGGYSDTSYIATLTFNTITLHSQAYGGTFLAKYNSSGNLLWAKSSDWKGYGYHVSTDLLQNVIMVGVSSDTILVFGTDTLFNNAFSMDAFVVKYDQNGNVLWARAIGGTSYDKCNGVATDLSGNVFVSGESNSAALNFGDTIINSTGGYHVFIAKYDASGNFLWARVSRYSGASASAGVTCDGSGNAYLAGNFGGDSIVFDNHTLYNSGSTPYYDLFLIKYDPAGNIIWARSDGGPGNGEQAFSISSRLTNNRIVICGEYGGSNGWSFGSSSLTASASGSFFVAEYDTAGIPLWASQSSGLTAIGFSVDADQNGNALVAGRGSGPGILSFGSQNMTFSSPIDESFIVKYDSTGNPVWSKHVDVGGDDQNGIAAGINGDIFFGGDFFIPQVTFGNDVLVNGPDESAFIAKMSFQDQSGVAEQLMPRELKIYPDPFSISTTVQLPYGMSDAELKLMDVSGREISEYSISGDRFELQRGDLKAGIYFITLSSSKGVIATEKVIVVH